MSNQDEQKGEMWEFRERPKERSRHFAWLDAIGPTGAKSTLGLLPAGLVDTIVADHAEVARLRAALEKITRRLHDLQHVGTMEACAMSDCAALRGEDA